MGALSACGADAAQEGQASSGRTATVEMAIQEGGLSSLPAIVAKQHGLFEKHGLDVQFVSVQGGAVLSSLVSGAVQFAVQAPQLVGTANQQGQDLRFFSGAIQSNNIVLVAPSTAGLPSTEDGASWEDVMRALKGKQVGIAALGASQEQWMNGLVKGAGMSIGDVTLVPVGVGASGIAALDSGQVDAIMTAPPAEQALVARGDVSVLLRLGDAGPFAGEMLTGYLATDDWLNANADVAKRLRQALDDGIRFIHSQANSQAVDRILMKEFAIKSPDARKAMLEPDGPLSRFDADIQCQSLERAITHLVDAGTLKPTADVCASMTWSAQHAK
jgi:ABC-type nitrate/sulfonate/bicarbonate transport system substrate-binding protein